MIIGIDASRANRSRKSGTEWYAYYLIRQLARLDDKNQYILYTDTPLKDGLVDLVNPSLDYNIERCKIEKPQFKRGYQIIKSPHNNFRGKVLKWPFKFLWTQGRLSLEMVINRPHVLFVPSHALPIIHPKRSIVTIHDIAFEKTDNVYENSTIGDYKKGLLSRILNILSMVATLGRYRASTLDYLRWSTEYALKHAKKIITISENSKKDLINVYDADAAKIKVIYNGYNDAIYKKIDDQKKIDSTLAKYGIKTPYFLYVGRIEKKKNIPALIEAFGILKNEDKEDECKLLLVGAAGYGFDEVNFLIRQYELTKTVIMPGWVSEEDVPYFYAGATAFIFPSIYEGFGIPLVQAMACGIPIAASNASCIPEVVNNCAALFDPKSPIDIADTLKEVKKNQELRIKLISSGLERAKNFSYKKCAQETLEQLTNQ